MEKILKVLMVEPHKEPYISQVKNTLEGMQKAVDGLIEVIDLEDHVALVCNEEGKLMGMEGNRSVGNDIIAGTFFVVGCNDEGNFISLLQDKIQKYTEMLQKPELFTKEQLEDTVGFKFMSF